MFSKAKDQPMKPPPIAESQETISVEKYTFIDALRRLEFAEEILLFGSRARGDHHDRSDIDLAIVCPKATDADWLKVVDIIENADTLLKIDCIRLNPTDISKNLYQNILKEKKVIYVKK